MLLKTHRLNYVFLVKDINITVFNLLSKTNETRYVSLHDTCACICGLDASVSSDKTRWHNDK